MTDARRARYVALFAAEARSLLGGARRTMAAWFEAPAETTHAEELFRALHTIKGMAASLGFEAATELTHGAETALAEVRAGHLAADRGWLRDLERTLEVTTALAPDRIALFGYAHVPHLIPRQRQIRTERLPGALARFNQAAFGYDVLTSAGYQPVGFDHFARPHDPLAAAARAGRLKRNFQGFTDDASEILIGIGASAISAFPDRLVQNEKNAGRYRMRASAGLLSGVLGVLRTNEDRLRGAVSNLGHARQIILGQNASVVGRLIHQTEVHQRLVDLADAGVVAAGAASAVAVVLRVFHDRDPAVRLRRRALQHV